MASGWCSRALLVCLALAAASARAGVYRTQDEALHDAFPDADGIAPKSYVLDDAQAQRVRALAETDLDRKIWTTGPRFCDCPASTSSLSTIAPPPKYS